MIKTLSQLYNLTNHPGVLYPWFLVKKLLHNLMKRGKARPHAATRGHGAASHGLMQHCAAKARPNAATRGLTWPWPDPSRPPYLVDPVGITV